MSSINEITNTGRLFDAVSKEAWDSFLSNDYERAQRLARQLLSQPRLGNVLKAAMHMIMATGNDQALDHARQAVPLYEYLFENIPNASLADKRWREIALEHARELLRKAEDDRVNLDKSINTHYGSSEAARQTFIALFGEQTGKRLEEEETFLNKNDEDEDDNEDGNEDDNEDDNEDEQEVENESQVEETGDHDAVIDQGAAGDQDVADPQDTAGPRDTARDGQATAMSLVATHDELAAPQVSDTVTEQAPMNTKRRNIKYSDAELADNPYLDTEYPMPEPDESSSAAPADNPLANMSLAELLKMGD